MERVGLSYSNPITQSSGTVAHQATDIFQSEDLFIMHLNGVINRNVMFLKI